jgi:hypothetical protein
MKNLEEVLITTQNNVVLQIVESSQVDLNDDNQVKLMGSATHLTLLT